MHTLGKKPQAITVDEVCAQDDLVKAIEGLIETMENIPYPESFDIGEWVDGHRESNECGYAACILGHHILRLGEYKQDLSREDEDLTTIASEYSDDLDNLCWAALGSPELASSIYLGNEGVRRVCASNTKLFSSSEIADFAYLNTEHPTASDAITYMKACLQKVCCRNV